MNPKQKSIKMHLFYVLMTLLLECLDELKITGERVNELHKILTDFCEVLNDEMAHTEAIQKTTYFQEISNKVNTIIRKSFNPDL